MAWCDETMMCHVLECRCTCARLLLVQVQPYPPFIVISSRAVAALVSNNVVPVPDKTDKVWNKNGTRNENKTNMPVTLTSPVLELRSCKSESFNYCSTRSTAASWQTAGSNDQSARPQVGARTSKINPPYRDQSSDVIPVCQRVSSFCLQLASRISPDTRYIFTRANIQYCTLRHSQRKFRLQTVLLY